MPIREFLCMDCNHNFEALIHAYEEGEFKVKCERCESEQVERQFPVTGGYHMNSGGSSTRPRGAGSRPKKSA